MFSKLFTHNSKAVLTVRLSKYEFLKQRVTYLGFNISVDGIEPGERKLRAIEDFRRPCNVHEVRRFLGLAGFFRRLVEKFAWRAAPLYELLKAGKSFGWNENVEASFNDLKEALTSRPILRLFDPKSYTALHTNASSQGLVAMLMQRDNNGRMHLVYAISRRTTEPERSYHSSKLELMAIVWRPININFVIVTDCQALVYLNAQKTRNPQICRWYNALSEFNFEIEHRSGVKMQHVDALSRAPTEDACCSETLDDQAWIFTLLNKEDEVLMYQSQDDELKLKIKVLRDKNPNEYSSYERGLVNDYKLIDGILFKDEQGKLKYVIPKALRKAMAVRFHDSQGHFGLDRILAKINRYYYFPRRRRYVKQHIGACLHCLMAKTQTGKQPGELHPIPPGTRPFAAVHLDHLGPFVTSSKGNEYILVIVDNLTKYLRLEALRSTNADNVVRRMENFVLEFGAPERFITDRGTCFTSAKFGEFCQKHGIDHSLNSPRHAQANGQVERANPTLIPTIMATLDGTKDDKDCDRKLLAVAGDLNNSINKTTGQAPFEQLYGYSPRINEGPIRRLTIEEEQRRYERPEILRETAIEKIKEG